MTRIALKIKFDSEQNDVLLELVVGVVGIVPEMMEFQLRFQAPAATVTERSRHGDPCLVPAVGALIRNRDRIGEIFCG